MPRGSHALTIIQ
ncbi:hypothetical protein CGCA056_v007437 [Colletotrichum aenigma]|nr:hypothetical protein CGCA056_v007437 [Colletotrichum aenigma]